MSSIFELDQEGWERRVADSRLEPVEEGGPGWFDDVFSATGQGIMRGGARVGQFLGYAAAPFIPYRKDHPEDLDPYFRGLDETVNSAVDFWTPDARTTGVVGKVLGGLGEIALPLAAAGGNPALLVGSQQMGTTADLAREGVDPTTAVMVGGLQGAATAVGFKIPVLGKTTAQRVFTSAVGNAGLNMATTFAQQKALEGGGYDALAEQYDPLDVEGRTIDLLIGAAFGFLPQGPRAMPRSDRNAVLAAANARHFQVDTAPGRPLDTAASAAHQRAMETAIEQLLRDEPVAVPPEVLDGNFEPRPARDEKETMEALREVLGDIPEPRAEVTPRVETSFEFTPSRSLRPEEKVIEQRFGEQLKGDIAAAERRYAALEDSRGGKILNVDTARELSDDYLKDRTKSSPVHEPASAFIKRLYAKKLSEPPKDGELPVVLFTAGGTGAGKSTAIKDALGGLADTAQIVYDTNMNGVASSIQKVDQALAAGKSVTIVYTFRDPVMALKEGALPRAMRQEKKFGSGRTVPLEEHLKTHLGAREAMERIASHYTGDSRVQVIVLDNTGSAGSAKPVALGSIPKFDKQAYNSLREQAVATLEAERTAGRISDAVYRGFAPVESASVARGVESEGGPGARRESQSQREEGVARFEDGKSSPPKPGEPFLVIRVADAPTLENGNAGNPQSIAGFLMRLDDASRSQPVGAEKSNTLYVHEVIAPPEFAKYELGTQRKQMAGDAVGRKANDDGVVYSFPEGKFQSRLVAEIPLRDLKGIDFDDLGTIAGGKRLEQFVEQRLAPTVSVATATGRKIEVRSKLIELEDAMTSDRTEYPQELQPRQRGARKALDNQVRDIAQNLDPARLGDSAEADRGAPITGPGNVVESGNGRVMALRYVYENLPEKAAEYRTFLEAEGYDLTGMKQPILVRERVTELSMDERRAFTVEANQAATAALSPVERAQADARILDAATLSQLRGGDIVATQNVGFVRLFLEQIPTGERNAMLNPDGTVSQEGVRRLQAALLAKAYGGKPESNSTLGRLLESTDSDMRSALGALLDAAPAFARLRQSIVDGKVGGEYDISGALTQAIENTAQLRMRGSSLRDYLAQQDMLTQRPPIVDDLMKALYDRSGTRMAGREKIAASLTKYAGQAAKQRLDQGSLFAEAPVAPEKLVASSAADDAESAAPRVTDMFGLRTPQTGAVAAVKEVLAEQDIPVATGELDADGNPVVRSGREVMAEAEAGIRKAEEDGKGFEAAVNCFLTRGLDDAA